jgi:ATPase family associated with various cellular activities (AAA)
VTSGAETAADEAYPDSLAHLLAELGRLDTLLKLRVDAVRAERPAGDDAAFHVSEAEADTLLQDPIGGADVPVVDPEGTGEEITRRVVATLRAGVQLRLVALAQLFGLSPFDVDVVVACLAPEIDARYARVYGYLHDDLTRELPTVGLLLDVLCTDLDTRLRARSRLGPAAPLRARMLVAVEEPTDRHAAAFRSHSTRLSRRVARFLLDDDTPDDALRRYCRLSVPTRRIDGLVLPPDPAARLATLAARPDGDLVVYLRGGPGVGKRSAAAALCATWGAALLTADGAVLATRPVAEFEELLARIDREARLQGAILYWSGVDVLHDDTHVVHRNLLLDTIARHPGPVLLGGGRPWPHYPAPGIAFHEVELPAPGPAERARLWAAALADALPDPDRPPSGAPALGSAPDPPAAEGLDLAELAARFRCSGARIRAAVAAARESAAARGAEAVTAGDLGEAVRLQSTRTLGALARRVDPGHGWDDLVLPPDRVEQLRDIVNHVRHRALVHETWGFGGTAEAGLNVLFAGPSGTGKTMAAGVLAHTLGLDLYKIDLSAVVSKFIGETEQNLAQIFAEAAGADAVLFFDEADALFGKRTQVRDAHDRYANLETSYLLQKLEEHDGVVVLATNLRKNVDEAFVRRLAFTVEFPLPDEADRLRIWRRVWPAAAPLADGVDLALLARRVDLPGGNIRNIAVAAAFLAAADGGVVTMAHLEAATRQEYQKMGKVRTAADLGAVR